MPRYYFRVIDELDCPDDEGAELPSLEAARTHAGSALLGMLAENVTHTGRVLLSHRIEIDDHQRVAVATVYLRDVVTIEP